MRMSAHMPVGKDTVGKEVFRVGITGSYGGLNLGDEAILEEARSAAGRLFAEPALLHSTDREALASRVRRLWEGGERH